MVRSNLVGCSTGMSLGFAPAAGQELDPHPQMARPPPSISYIRGLKICRKEKPRGTKPLTGQSLTFEIEGWKGGERLRVFLITWFRIGGECIRCVEGRFGGIFIS